MKSTFSEPHASAIFFAMRQTNFSDSMTHGSKESRSAGILKSRFLLS